MPLFTIEFWLGGKRVRKPWIRKERSFAAQNAWTKNRFGYLDHSGKVQLLSRARLLNSNVCAPSSAVNTDQRSVGYKTGSGWSHSINREPITQRPDDPFSPRDVRTPSFSWKVVTNVQFDLTRLKLAACRTGKTDYWFTIALKTYSFVTALAKYFELPVSSLLLENPALV